MINWQNQMKEHIQKILHKFGYQINKYPDLDVRRRIKIAQHNGIDMLLDVGANQGQYAMQMRKAGYTNEIISFEPIKSVYQKLLENSKEDPLWAAENYALGNEDKSETINISGHSLSSSILGMLPKHVEFAPDSGYIGTEQITVKKLDSFFDSLFDKGNNIMLKIDTQGYEKQVLEGAINSLKNIRLLQLEMSLTRLYEDEMLIDEMMLFIKNLGFNLISFENGIYDFETGELLQVDGVFVNDKVS
jgi:FkbM family methyltransferase